MTHGLLEKSHMISVVCGGVGTLLVVAAIALLWPEIRNYGRLDG